MRSTIFFLLLVLLSSVSEASSNCTSSLECGNGFCDITVKHCNCDAGWVASSSGNNCSYEQKKQTIAFLLQFFLGPFGAGEFYVKNNELGAGKIILTVGSVILFGANKCFQAMSRTVSSQQSTAINKYDILALGTMLSGVLGMSATVAWWLADTIRFGLNKIKDANGYPLKSW